MNKIMLSGIILSLLFIVGCDGIGTSKQAPPDVHKGTQGLQMTFVSGTPPKEVFTETLFQIALDFQNKGATDISNGQFLVSVEDEFVLMQDRQREPLRLQGKSLFTIDGERAIRTLNARALPLPEQSQQRTTRIRATACYPYQTQASADVCVDTDPLGLRKGTKPCKPLSQGLSGGQGGPVSVTNVQTEMLPHEDPDFVRPFFTISLANVGNGQVFSKNKVREACSATPLSDSDLNVVAVSASLGDQRLDCTPTTLRLSRAKEVRCALEDGISKEFGTYTSPLKIIIDYGYTFTISQDMTIKKPQ